MVYDFSGELDKEEFLANVDFPKCCGVDEKLGELESFLSEGGLVLLSKTVSRRVNHEPAGYFAFTSYCLANAKDVEIGYSVDTIDNSIWGEGVDVNLDIKALGVVYHSKGPISSGRDRALQGNLLFKVDEDVILAGKSGKDFYLMHKKDIFSDMILPYGFSRNEVDIGNFLSMVGYEGEVGGEGFFDNVEVAYLKMKEKRKPFIWVEKR